MKKVVSILLCLAMMFSLAVPAFAESAASTGSTTGETITMKHTDVVVRSAPGTSNSKVGTLYVGERVVVTNWHYRQVGTYWWVQIEWNTDSGFGYVREDLIP